MKVLVTGGCGFIGSNLAKRLVKDKVIVDIIDNLESGRIDNLGFKFKTVLAGMIDLEVKKHAPKKGRARVITGDFSSASILKKVKCGEYDIIYHLAANPRVSFSIDFPVESHEENTYKSIALFKAAADSNTRIVFSSSSAIYGMSSHIPTSEDQEKLPTNPYGLQKLHCEHYLELFYVLYGLQSISLRYFNVYGPNAYGDSPYSTAIAAWCNAIHDGKPLRSDGDGEQTRDLVYIDDIVEANILAGSCKTALRAEKVNIASGQSYSNNVVLRMLEKKIGNLEIIKAPERFGDVRHTLGMTKKAKKLIGFKSKVSLDAGLNKTIKWWETLK